MHIVETMESSIVLEDVSYDHTLDADSLQERLRDHPRDAFEELVRLYQADVRVLTRRHLGRSSTADDVAQKVFIAIYQSLSKYRAEGSLRAWVLGITINQIRSHIRSEVRRRQKQEHVIAPELLETSATTTDSDPFAFESAQQDLGALRDCLSRLDQRHQKVIQAFYFQNQSAETIGQEIGQSSGAIRMLLMRIRERLGKCIRKKVQRQENDE
jgi:RNA polymerase sigma-70 factor (ECF subfamily)